MLRAGADASAHHLRHLVAIRRAGRIRVGVGTRYGAGCTAGTASAASRACRRAHRRTVCFVAGRHGDRMVLRHMMFCRCVDPRPSPSLSLEPPPASAERDHRGVSESVGGFSLTGHRVRLKPYPHRTHQTHTPTDMNAFSAFGSGPVFGLGLVISGMADPAKVLAFLDVTGRFDPSLRRDGQRLAVSAIAFAIARGRTASTWAVTSTCRHRASSTATSSPARSCSASAGASGRLSRAGVRRARRRAHRGGRVRGRPCSREWAPSSSSSAAARNASLPAQTMLVFRQLFDASRRPTLLLGDGAARGGAGRSGVRAGAARRRAAARARPAPGGHARHARARRSRHRRVAAEAALRQRRSWCRARAARRARTATRPRRRVAFGQRHLEVRATPGHTGGCLTYVSTTGAWPSPATPADPRLRPHRLPGRQRAQLYRSVHSQILSLPDDACSTPRTTTAASPSRAWRRSAASTRAWAATSARTTSSATWRTSGCRTPS